MLTQLIDFKDFANQEKRLEGECSLSEFKRLVSLILNPQDKVSYELFFHRDERRKVVIESHIRVVLEMSCQRCEEPVSCELDLNSRLSPVNDDQQAKALSKQYEPFQVPGDEVQLIEILEEELLLGLPMVARHEEQACPRDLSSYLKS